MDIYLGFLKSDNAAGQKARELVCVQSIEPKGGDLDLCEWKVIDEPDLVTARVGWSPVCNDVGMIARYRLNEDGETVEKATANKPALKTIKALMQARQQARVDSGMERDEIEDRYITEIGKETDSAFVRAVKWILRR